MNHVSKNFRISPSRIQTPGGSGDPLTQHRGPAVAQLLDSVGCCHDPRGCGWVSETSVDGLEFQDVREVIDRSNLALMKPDVR